MSIFGEGRAFPNVPVEYSDGMRDIQRGMDIRTYLTGQSITAAAIYLRNNLGVSPQKIAERAVNIADAVIEELNKK